MKQIIDIPDELFSIFKKHGIMAFDYVNEYDKDQIAIAITHGTPYNPSGDAISRKDLQAKHDESCAGECACCAYGVDYTKSSDSKFHCLLIDNAQAISLPNEQIAWEQGYEAGLAQGKHDRPQGEWENDSDNLPICNKCGEIALQRIFVKMPHLIQDVRMVRSNYCPNCGANMQKG